MTCSGKQFVIVIFILLLVVNISLTTEEWPTGSGSTMALNLAEIVKNLLNNLYKGNNWSEHLNSALAFTEFLVKRMYTQMWVPIWFTPLWKCSYRITYERMRHYKSPVLDSSIGSLYLEILEKISLIRSKVIQSFGVHNLEALLEQNLIITNYDLRKNQIDTKIEYKSMLRDYSSTTGTGFPNNTFASLCLVHMQGLELCERLRRACLAEIKFDIPTYGYRRTHQVLQLYFLMHHSCAHFYGTRLSFEILATEHCSQVYREHQTISALDDKEWQDLYIEQSAVCGLFGFAEFINIKELERIIEWESESPCSCIKSHLVAASMPDYCHCTGHKYSVLLVLFVNAMLYLI